jgi:2-keto-4-pentenoate hydratase/2-oxohepta-3-ene-1,7-dioic acid hydratase in catechol pathway
MRQSDALGGGKAMRLVTYLSPHGQRRAGIAVEDRIVDLAAGAAALGYALAPDILALLALGESGMGLARQVAEEARAGRLPGWPQDRVTLTAAVPRPPKLLLLAANYQSHIVEAGIPPVDKTVITPRFFIKPSTAVIGTGDPIKIPPISEKIDYELEIAAVIGRTGRDIPEAAAADYVAGYVVFNDVSARELTIAQGRQPREMDDFFDWLNGKWCDTFAAVGPYLVTMDEIEDPTQLEMSLRVNGELRQHSSAGEMIFTVPESIAFISQFVTLEPGDLICMGTPGGVGETTQTYLRPGDLVEAEIERLGRLVNRVA